MKKQILFTIALVIALFACTQDPPKKVTDAFTNKFTNTTDVRWEQENENEWEADFKSEGTEMSASFTNDGKWLETETLLNKKDIPADVYKAVLLKFEGWEVDEVESIETPDFKGYEMVLEKEDTETEILVSESGEIQIMSVIVEEEDHDEDEDEDDDDDEDEDDDDEDEDDDEDDDDD